MSKHIEVRFRGENESNLLAWRPSPHVSFSCTAGEARERFDDLVERGLDGIAVDGVVPFVVEIREMRQSRRYEAHTRVKTLLWQYCEPNAPMEGPWADDAISTHGGPTVKMTATN